MIKIPTGSIKFTDLRNRLHIYKHLNEDGSTVFINKKVHLIKAIDLHINDVIDLNKVDLRDIKIEDNTIKQDCYCVVDQLQDLTYLQKKEEFEKQFKMCLVLMPDDNSVAVATLDEYYDNLIKE